jgi:hypothetical protein
VVQIVKAKGTEAVFKEKRVVWDWDPLLELTKTSPYFIVDSDVQPSTPTTRKRGGVGKVFPIGWVHLYEYMSGNFYKMFFMLM